MNRHNALISDEMVSKFTMMSRFPAIGPMARLPAEFWLACRKKARIDAVDLPDGHALAVDRIKEHPGAKA